MDLRCTSCGAPLHIDESARVDGWARCPGCDQQQDLPELLKRGLGPERPPPIGFRGNLERTSSRLGLYLPPVGLGGPRRHYLSVAAAALLGSALCALAAITFDPLFWIGAVVGAPIGLAAAVLVLAFICMHRRVTLDTESASYEYAFVVLGLKLPLISRHKSWPRAELLELGHRRFGTGPAAQAEGSAESSARSSEEPLGLGGLLDAERDKLLLIHASGRETVGIAPDMDRSCDLEWIADQAARFLLRPRGAQEEEAGPGTAPSRAVAPSRGRVRLHCNGCGAPVPIDAEAVMRRLARCRHCRSQIVLHHGLVLPSPGEGYVFDPELKGSAIQLFLAENAIRVVVPRQGLASEAFTGAVAVALLVLPLLVGAGVMLARGLAAESIGWLAGAAGLATLAGMVCWLAWPMLRSLIEEVVLELSLERFSVQRRFLWWTRRRGCRLDELTGVSLRLPASAEFAQTSELSYELRIELRNGEYERLGFSEHNDDFEWIADELNAFLRSAAALRPRPDEPA